MWVAGSQYHYYQWVLERDQWQYLLNRTETKVINGVEKTIRLCGYGKVNGVNGIILLPDAWVRKGQYESLTPDFDDSFVWLGGIDATFNVNVFNGDSWTALKNMGVAFLPAAGYAHYDTKEIKYAGYELYYWTATPSTENNEPCEAPFILRNEAHPGNVWNCRFKCSVRLVEFIDKRLYEWW